MTESKLVIDNGAAQGRPETSHVLMHREHRQWLCEDDLSRRYRQLAKGIENGLGRPGPSPEGTARA